MGTSPLSSGFRCHFWEVWCHLYAPSLCIPVPTLSTSGSFWGVPCYPWEWGPCSGSSLTTLGFWWTVSTYRCILVSSGKSSSFISLIIFSLPYCLLCTIPLDLMSISGSNPRTFFSLLLSIRPFCIFCCLFFSLLVIVPLSGRFPQSYVFIYVYHVCCCLLKGRIRR